MIRESVTIDETIVLLNQALALDRVAMTQLMDARVRCSLALADHPTIQAASSEEAVRLGVVTSDEQPCAVGLLGIVNGLFGSSADGYGAIAMQVDIDTGIVDRFFRMPQATVPGVAG
jgi:hypothetical protein